MYQGIVGCTPIPTYPVMRNPYISPKLGYDPQKSLENTINTMGTRTLGVHPCLSLEYCYVCCLHHGIHWDSIFLAKITHQ